jgi:adenylate kinase
MNRILGILVALLLALPSAAYAQRAVKAAPVAKPAATQQSGKRVLVFVGMPGAGKSTAAELVGKKLGVKKLSTGDAIRNTIAERGLPYNEKTDRAIAEEFAKTPGEIGRRTAATVAKDGNKWTIVEGFRAVADLEAFKKAFPEATVVAVEVGTERRHDRMLERGRTGEDNKAYLRDRDRAEVRRGVRDVMNKADVRIRPRGDSMESLERSLDNVLRAIQGGAK